MSLLQHHNFEELLPTIIFFRDDLRYFGNNAWNLFSNHAR